MRRMVNLLSFLLVAALAAVLGVLVTGVFAFARGGELNRRHATFLMNLRVAVQALAVLILGLLFLFRGL